MKTIPSMLAVAAAGLLALGCSDGRSRGGGTTTGGTSPATGTVNVQVTDAPFPFSSVASARVTLTEVALHGREGLAAVTSADGARGFATVWTGSVTLDLVPLQNGLTTALASAQLPTGTYDQARLVITGGQVTLTNGRTFELAAPAAAAAGLRLFIDPPLVVQAGASTDLLLDIDLARSFSAVPSGAPQAGPITAFQLHPVARAVNVATTGRISGRVSDDRTTGGDRSDDPPLPFATVTVTRAGSATAEATAISGQDGRYVVIGLAPGTYDVQVEAAGFTTRTAQARRVEAGGVTTVDVDLARTP